jgi:multidrug efflux pump subunit AcrA (membrane-fusion protein)
VQMRAVEIATILEESTVIGRGLVAGDRVVVAGQYRLAEGTRVIESNSSPAVEARKDRP